MYALKNMNEVSTPTYEYTIVEDGENSIVIVSNSDVTADYVYSGIPAI